MPGPTLGIMHDFRKPAFDQRSYAGFHSEALTEVSEADRLGFDTVWLSEHHFSDDGFLPSPLVMAAAIAARTRRIRIGTSVLVLPLHHPLRVAEDSAVVDLISGGRFVLGVAAGYAAAEFDGFGVNRQHRAGLLEEGVDLIRQAHATGRVTLAGRHWTYRDQAVSPMPTDGVPIYLGGVAEPAVRRALRIGDGLLLYCATPADFADRRRLVDRILTEAQQSGRPVDARRNPCPLVCTTIVHVDDDADRAWVEARPGIAYLEGGLAANAGTRSVLHDRADYLVGTPEEVADRIVELRRQVSYDHLAYWARLPGLDHHRAVETMRLVAERVVPTLARAGFDVTRFRPGSGASP